MPSSSFKDILNILTISVYFHYFFVVFRVPVVYRKKKSYFYHCINIFDKKNIISYRRYCVVWIKRQTNQNQKTSGDSFCFKYLSNKNFLPKHHSKQIYLLRKEKYLCYHLCWLILESNITSTRSQKTWSRIKWKPSTLVIFLPSSFEPNCFYFCICLIQFLYLHPFICPISTLGDLTDFFIALLGN